MKIEKNFKVAYNSANQTIKNFFLDIVNGCPFCLEKYSTDTPDFRLKHYRVYCRIALSKTKIDIFFPKINWENSDVKKIFSSLKFEEAKDQYNKIIKVSYTENPGSIILDELIKMIKYAHDNEFKYALEK